MKKIAKKAIKVDTVLPVQEVEADVIESSEVAAVKPATLSLTPELIGVAIKLSSMIKDEENAYSIRFTSKRCVIERIGVSPAMVIEDTIYDAFKAIGS